MRRILFTVVLISVHSLLFAGDLGKLCDLINNQKYSKALEEVC
jgi:hypothetical protein